MNYSIEISGVTQ